jgi:hypothetical protein
MPRTIMKELYTDLKPVYNDYKKDYLAPYCNTETEDYGVDFDKVTHAMKSMKNLSTINSYGYINKVQKWYLDYIYENF